MTKILIYYSLCIGSLHPLISHSLLTHVFQHSLPISYTTVAILSVLCHFTVSHLLFYLFIFIFIFIFLCLFMFADKKESNVDELLEKQYCYCYYCHYYYYYYYYSFIHSFIHNFFHVNSKKKTN